MFRKITFTIALLMISGSTFAQLEIGASYELRDEEPKNGFGVRIQSGFLNQIPLVSLGLRAHFSYFSETNMVDETTFSYDKNIQNYDFGLAVVAGVKLGLLEPYVGAGLGSETLELTAEDFSNTPPPGQNPDNENESNIYWNTFAGAKVTVIPLVKPFVEYRFSARDLQVPDIEDKTGRIIFGVVLSF